MRPSVPGAVVLPVTVLRVELPAERGADFAVPSTGELIPPGSPARVLRFLGKQMRTCISVSLGAAAETRLTAPSLAPF